MPLSPQRLRAALSPLFQDGTMPQAGPDAVARWGRAYATYAQDALAGGTLPGPLVPQPVSGEFLQALDASLRAMWMAAVWTGPGLAGTTAVVPALVPYLLSHAGQLNRSFDRELALSLITEAVHTYTLSITVSVVPPSGTPSIVPLT